MNPTLKLSPLHAESELIQTIFDGIEVYPNLSPEDFREMAKFEEQTNIAGLPVHPIARPVGDQSAREFTGRFEDLPDANPKGPIASLRELLSGGPNLVIRGCLAGAGSRPFRVVAFVPQSEAHLAHGFSELLWPDASAAANEPADLYLIQVPYVADRFILNVPASKLGLIAGTDDLRPALLIAIEAAHRLWSERIVDHEKQLESRGSTKSKTQESWEEIRLLPGGSFPFSPEAASAPALLFNSESIPDEWERIVAERVPELSGPGPAEVFLSGSEPWVAEGGGWISPLLKSPFLPARELAAAPRWSTAASHPDALPFGVLVNPKGEIDLSQGREDAFVIIPRHALPSPFLNSSERSKVDRLITYRFAKPEAMELWARGFPAPEIIFGNQTDPCSCGE